MTNFLVIHKFHPSGERVTPATLLIQRFVVMYKKLMEIIYVLSSGGEIEKFQYCSSQSGCCSELQSRSLVYAYVIVTLNPESFWTGVMHRYMQSSISVTFDQLKVLWMLLYNIDIFRYSETHQQS